MMLFNDSYDAQIDLAELARHLWGSEVISKESLTSESAGVRSILQQDSQHATGKKGGPSSKGQGADGYLPLGLAATPPPQDGTLLRIRFPKTVAYREREIVCSSDEEDDCGAAGVGMIDEDRGGKGRERVGKRNGKGTNRSEADAQDVRNFIDVDELPMLSVLSTTHADNPADLGPTATPILGSTFFGAVGDQAGAGAGASMLPPMASGPYGFGSALFPSLPPSAHKQLGDQSKTGFSELYRSVLPSTAHGASSGDKESAIKALKEEATVDDLVAIDLRHQQADLGDSSSYSTRLPPTNRAPAATSSLFELNALFGASKLELNQPLQNQQQPIQGMLTAADVHMIDNPEPSQEGQTRRKRRTVEKITFDSIFCTVARKGAVSIVGSIPAEELPAVCQMVHEYLARTILSSCPWCVTLSAFALPSQVASRRRHGHEELPPISPKEMLTCGSGNAWREFAQSRFRAECMAERDRIEREAMEKRDREEAILAPPGDDDGFALPFAPAPKKVLVLAPQIVPGRFNTPSELSSALPDHLSTNVLEVRTKRLRALLSLSLEPKPSLSMAGTSKIQPVYCGQSPPPSCILVPDLEYLALTDLEQHHSMRVANVMSHVTWGDKAIAALQKLRGLTRKNESSIESRHLLVGEFEKFVENVSKWSLIRRQDSLEWRPIGVIIVLASTQDYCRFEWNFNGRVTEVIAQRKSATFRIVISTDAADCKYISEEVIPSCLGFL